MRIRHASRSLLALLLVSGVSLAGLLGPVRSAAAQDSNVSLSLLGQTPWTSGRDPELRIAVVASNLGQARIGDLSVGVTLGSGLDSRFAYQSALAGDPFDAGFSTTFPFRGTLGPGVARTFTVLLDTAAISAIDQDDSRIYPLTIDLRTGGATAGSLTTAAIHMVRTPEAPLHFTWWLELTAPPAFAPDGVLTDPSIEAKLAPGGSLGAPITALRRFVRPRSHKAPIDLVVQPSLLAEVVAMAGGFTRPDGTEVAAGEGGAATAAAFLDGVREVVGLPQVKIVAMPFAAPRLPAILGTGLGSDVTRHVVSGTKTTLDVLGVEALQRVARPPDGALDGLTLDWLARAGTPIVLANADTVERPAQENDFAPPPLATATGPGGGSVTLVLPDPGVQALLERPDLLADPVRASQILLGELALVWKELPIPASPTVRGLAMALPSTLPPPVWAPLIDRVAGAPFLAHVHPTELATTVHPAGLEEVLRSPDTATFSFGYAERIRRLRRDVDTYASMLVEPSDRPASMRRSLLYAEAGVYVGDEARGGAWLDQVGGVVEQAFAGTVPQVDQVFTFTSREGTIPLLMGDPGPVPLRVLVQLQSSQFAFPDGDRQEIVLERPGQVVSFRVVARASGQNPIRVQVLAPSGSEISAETIVVRTTAANRIALIVTLGAAAMLILLYSRRWVRRLRSRN